MINYQKHSNTYNKNWSVSIYQRPSYQKKLINYNINVIPIKTSLAIKMTHLDNYKVVKLYKYQYLISKLIYFAYSIRPDIIFVIRQFSKYNIDPRKNYFSAIKRVI